MPCSSCNKKKNIVQTGTAILTGIKNTIFSNEEIDSLSESRLEKCNSCTSSKVVLRINNKVVLQCKECKCFCDLKTKVPDEVCPLNKW